MTRIEQFFAEGVKDQLSVMGSTVQLVSMPDNTESAEFQAVVTSRNGDLQLEYSGALYTVSAHALIPLSQMQVPKVGNQLISGTEKFLIVSVVRSVIDQAYACDLVKIG